MDRPSFRFLPPRPPRRVVVLVLLVVLGSLLSAGAWLTRTTEVHLDICSGEQRHRVTVFGVAMRADRRATWLSRAAGAAPSARPQWRLIDKDGPMHMVRAGHQWQRVLGPLHNLEEWDRLTPLPAGTRRAVAEHILELWVRHQNPYPAEDFMAEVVGTMMESIEWRGPQTPLTPKDFGL